MQLDSRVHGMRIPSGSYQTLYIGTRLISDLSTSYGTIRLVRIYNHGTIDARHSWNLNLHKNHYYQAFVIIQKFIVNVWP